MTAVPLASRRAGEAQAYAGLFALRGVVLPLRPAPEPAELGVVRDATGRDVLVVDVNGDRSEADVAAIAALIADAVNARGAP